METASKDVLAEAFSRFAREVSPAIRVPGTQLVRQAAARRRGYRFAFTALAVIFVAVRLIDVVWAALASA